MFARALVLHFIFTKFFLFSLYNYNEKKKKNIKKINFFLCFFFCFFFFGNGRALEKLFPAKGIFTHFVLFDAFLRLPKIPLKIRLF